MEHLLIMNIIVHWLIVGLLVVGLINGILSIKNLLAGKPIFKQRERKKQDKEG